MGESNKTLYARMLVDVVIGPVLDKLEKRDISAAHTLRAAFSKADNTLPGFVYDTIRGMLRKAEITDKVDMCETLLRLGGTQDCDELKLYRPERTFQDLSRCSTGLKAILSKIPDQIYDRKQFLETIKEIASSIKMLLDAFNKVIEELPFGDSGSKQILEDRKKEFVRYSKKFSNMLKEFFRDSSQKQNVFMSANFLIFQTNVILRTVKQECC